MRSRTALSILMMSSIVSASVEPALGGPGRSRSSRARTAGQARARQPVSAATVVATPLYQRPGESSRKVARLPRGTEVEVLSQRGRWLEARADGQRGWVPRSTVARREAVTGGAPVDPAAGWTPGGAGDDRGRVWMDPAGLVEVGRAGPARAEPRAEAAIVFEVIPGALVHPTGESRAGWTLVEDASGAVGWVARGTLSARRPGLASPPAPGHPVAEAALPDDDAEELAARAATSPVEPTVERSAGGEAAAGAPGLAVRSLFQPRWVRARASLGVSSFSMSFSSNGTTPLSAYRLSSSAMAAFAGVEAGMWRGRWCAALDGLYGVTVGMPGIRNRDAEGGELDPLGFVWHHSSLGARVGYRIGDAFVPHARLGYHFDWFAVEQVENTSRLAREGLRGVTLGLGFAGALSDEILVRGGGDVLVAGGRKQTPGLEDGLRSTELAAWGRLQASYLASDALAVEGTYEYGWASTEWTGQSNRQPDVSSALRTDRSHLLLLSLQRQF